MFRMLTVKFSTIYNNEREKTINGASYATVNVTRTSKRIVVENVCISVLILNMSEL